ncbi:MAG: hypothetical protein JO072_05075 [Parafilimonas sp.]|nr:hypothetical protein [Parafilimonas sp.]
MKHFKFLLVTVVLAFSFNSSFADVTIYLSIEGGKLVVDKPTVRVAVGDNITWQINDPNIHLFWFMQNTMGTNPFTTSVPTPATPSSTSFTIMARRANDPDGWTYHLGARLNMGGNVFSDPKIIVRPRTGIYLKLASILAALFGILSIFLAFTVMRLNKKIKVLKSSSPGYEHGTTMKL